MKKTVVAVLILISVFAFHVGAESKPEEFIKNQAELSGADELPHSLPEEEKKLFEDKNINPDDGSWISDLSVGGILNHLWSVATEKCKTPFYTMSILVAVVLLGGAIGSMEHSSMGVTAEFAVTAVSAAILVSPVIGVIGSAVEVMQNVAVFMTAFIPVFAAVVAANGQAVTGTAMSGLLLGATQVVEMVANYLIVPLMCGYLSLSIVSVVSPLLSRFSLAEAVKKLSFWIMSLMTTLFLGVLSIQTAINASADSLALRTARFVIGTSVPVAGTVLSEALTTVTASLGVLKTTVAIYGVVACCAIFLPLLVELVLWRIALNLSSGICETLSQSNISKLIKCMDTAISVLCGIILLSMALFVISLCVVVSAGRV